MATETKQRAPKKRILKVRIERIEHDRMVVRIPGSNQRHVIKRKEWQWDRSVHAKLPPEFKIGKTIEVLDFFDSGRPCLSIKRITDPWEDVSTKTFYPGKQVSGEVVGLFSKGENWAEDFDLEFDIRSEMGFIQIEPGIDAVLYPSQVPLRKEERLSDVLSIGDLVMVEILSVDLESRRVEVSINNWLEYLNATFKDRNRTQFEIFGNLLNNGGNGGGNTDPVEISRNQIRTVSYYPIPFPKDILLIDNDREISETTKKQLENALPVQVDIVSSSDEALKALDEKQYGLLLIDIRLQGEHGFDLAKGILARKEDQPILFISGDPFALSEIEAIKGRWIPFVHRDGENVEEIISTIEKMQKGFSEDIVESDDQAYIGKDNYLQQFEQEVAKRGDLEDTLNRVIRELHKEIKVSYVFVLKVDRGNEKVETLAQAVADGEDIPPAVFPQLYFSDVKEVVLNESTFYVVHINKREDRYRNLFRGLDYSSCYGLPVLIPGITTQYALFVLDKKGEVFELTVIDKIKLACNFLSIAFERDTLHTFIRRIEKRYFLGELLSSFGHEFSALLTTLEGLSHALPEELKQLNDPSGFRSRDELFQEVHQTAEGIKRNAKKFRILTEAYGNLIRGKYQPVDINDVLERMENQLNKQASESQVIMEIKKEDIPPVWAIASRLEQIVKNVVLNAIQQIEIQALHMRKISSEKGENKRGLLQNGWVLVQTHYCEVNSSCRVIIADTGPGIHYDQQHRIFSLGVTTRGEGHGLGLYICRNLAEPMGGKIWLGRSYLFTGSAFIIEFPVLNHKQTENA